MSHENIFGSDTDEDDNPSPKQKRPKIQLTREQALKDIKSNWKIIK